jgi:hypothetical protein
LRGVVQRFELEDLTPARQALYHLSYPASPGNYFLRIGSVARHWHLRPVTLAT